MYSGLLPIIEEDRLKKGGRVKKTKKTKKSKKTSISQTVIVNVGQAKPKKRSKPRVDRSVKRGVPGAPSATTGFGSVVFGAPQAPSYFRAVQPDQQYGNVPDVLKGLKQGQETIMKELEKRRAQEAADRVFATRVKEEEEDLSPKKIYSPPVSGSGTPKVKYDFAQPIPLRPLSSLLPDTLNPLQRQRSITPNIIIPEAGSFQLPSRAISPSYTGSLSSKEAMSAPPYRGADESLPLQPRASGDQMVPESNVASVAASSLYVPQRSFFPESQSDSLGRSVSAPAYRIPGTNKIGGYRIPGTNEIGGIRRPTKEMIAPDPAAPAAPAAPAPRKGMTMSEARARLLVIRGAKAERANAAEAPAPAAPGKKFSKLTAEDREKLLASSREKI
jgi:hypothetical protein